MAEQQIILNCLTCGEGLDAPDTGMGRAIAAAWRTHHHGHNVTEGS